MNPGIAVHDFRKPLNLKYTASDIRYNLMKTMTIPLTLLVTMIALFGTASAQRAKQRGPGYDIEKIRKSLHSRSHFTGYTYSNVYDIGIEIDSAGKISRYYSRRFFPAMGNLETIIRKTRFTPSIIDGVPMPSWTHLHFEYELSRKYRSGRCSVTEVNAGIGKAPQNLIDLLTPHAPAKVIYSKIADDGTILTIRKSLSERKEEPIVEDTVAAERGVFVSAEHLPDWDQDELQRAVVYPESARNDEVAGTVLVNVLVSNTGRVVRTVIDSENESALEAAAIDAVMKTKFTPAVQNGKAIPYWVQVPVRFTLPE